MASFGRGGGRGGGGRHHNNSSSSRFNSNSMNTNATNSSSQQPKLQVCRNYIATGSCSHGPRCNFSHVVRHYATVDVSDKLPPSESSGRQYHHHQRSSGGGGGGGKVKDRYKATSVAIWETTAGQIKLFVAAHDGKWRLYNTAPTIAAATAATNHRNPHAAASSHLETSHTTIPTTTPTTTITGVTITQEFEHYVGGPIDTLHLLSNNYLFVGFEVSGPLEAPLESNKAGMVHVWNLHNPSDAPLEFMMHGMFAKYASSGKVRCLCTTTSAATTISGGGNVVVPSPPRVWSGGNDGVIREWRAATTPTTTSSIPPQGGGGFVLVRTLSGHLGAVTKLTLSNNGSVLWSGGIDGTIRLWNVDSSTSNDGEMMMAHLIPAVKKETAATAAAGGGDPTAASAMLLGHSAAITGLLPFEIPSSDPSGGAGGSSSGASSSSFVFTSSLDETVKVWNASNGSCVASEKHGQGVTSIAFTTDASGTHPLLICGLYYGDIMIRGTISNPPLCLLLKISHNFVGVGHELGPVHDIQAGPGCTFYAVGEDGKLTVWQIVGDFGL